MSAECQHFPYLRGNYIPHTNICYNGCVPVTRNSTQKDKISEWIHAPSRQHVSVLKRRTVRAIQCAHSLMMLPLATEECAGNDGIRRLMFLIVGDGRHAGSLIQNINKARAV